MNKTIFIRSISVVAIVAALVFGPYTQAKTNDGKSNKNECYVFLQKVNFEAFSHKNLSATPRLVTKAYGTEIPIVRAFEKEGLFYEDIAAWFPTCKPETSNVLRKRLEDELAGIKPKHLSRFLKKYAEKYRPTGVRMSASEWSGMNSRQQLEFILANPDIFSMITLKGKSELFYDGVLNFDYLAVSEATPKFITVGDDLGSYEVKTAGGLEDKNEYFTLRDNTEEFMEGKVGHQHLVHGWPANDSARQKIAPQYIELLDSSTWFLFWRQMKRDPEEFASIIDHPYLGVYTHESLERLYNAMMEGDVSRFKNKFRMVGARTLKADPKIKGQASNGEIIPDFEMRSGNKGEKRTLVESVIESRISSGDYDGLKKFNEYSFDPSASIEELTSRFLTKSEIETLQKFEQNFSFMKWSDNGLAHNHFRNKITSPLLPWQNRLSLGAKENTLISAQQEYAQDLYNIAKKYNKRMLTTKLPTTKSEIREETMEEIQAASYKFSDRVRLDQDFERYLMIRPKTLPSLSNVKFNIDEIDLGIEYSFRFPEKIESKQDAERHIKFAVESFQKKMGGGTIERVDDGGHGHGLSVRYRYTDTQGKIWRFEWDGILREYKEGVPVNPYGGHMEVPTPKFSPKDMSEIKKLYEAARESGMTPKRSAGGSHVNIDLAQFLALEPKVGARKMVDFINYFESNRDLVSFIWQHPSRARVAIPVELTPELVKALNDFNGDWKDLAEVLYTEKYFNTYVGRKPRYIQMNTTSLITPVAPSQYMNKAIDIKNPTQKWFPEFGTGSGRIEFRLFDAMEDEYTAALQIKYVRALMDKALNRSDRVQIQFPFTAEHIASWKTDPSLFLKDASAHLKDLGLDPEEFKPLLTQSWDLQQYVPPVRNEHPKKYKKFLPPKLDKSSRNDISPIQHFKKITVLNRGREIGNFENRFGQVIGRRTSGIYTLDSTC